MLPRLHSPTVSPPTIGTGGRHGTDIGQMPCPEVPDIKTTGQFLETDVSSEVSIPCLVAVTGGVNDEHGDVRNAT